MRQHRRPPPGLLLLLACLAPMAATRTHCCACLACRLLSQQPHTLAGLRPAQDLTHRVCRAGPRPAGHAADGRIPGGGRKDAGGPGCNVQGSVLGWNKGAGHVTRDAAGAVPGRQAAGAGATCRANLQPGCSRFPHPAPDGSASLRSAQHSTAQRSTHHARRSLSVSAQVTFKGDGPLNGIQVIAGERQK